MTGEGDGVAGVVGGIVDRQGVGEARAVDQEHADADGQDRRSDCRQAADPLGVRGIRNGFQIIDLYQVYGLDNPALDRAGTGFPSIHLSGERTI